MWIRLDLISFQAQKWLVITCSRLDLFSKGSILTYQESQYVSSISEIAAICEGYCSQLRLYYGLGFGMVLVAGGWDCHLCLAQFQ